MVADNLTKLIQGSEQCGKIFATTSTPSIVILCQQNVGPIIWATPKETKRTEYKKDASQHPYLDSGETLGLRRVGRDVVENVDEDEEERYEKRHST